MSRRKSAARAKLNAASQEDRRQKWKEHFKNILGSSPEITDKPPEKISNSKLDVKLGQFRKEKLGALLKRSKIKTEKLKALMKYLLKYGRQESLSAYFFD